MLNFCQDLHESNNLSAYINVEGFPELTVLNCIGILTLFRPFQRTSKYATLTSLARDGFPGATGHVGPDGDKPTWVRGSCASTHTSSAVTCNVACWHATCGWGTKTRAARLLPTRCEPLGSRMRCVPGTSTAITHSSSTVKDCAWWKPANVCARGGATGGCATDGAEGAMTADGTAGCESSCKGRAGGDCGTSPTAESELSKIDPGIIPNVIVRFPAKCLLTFVLFLNQCFRSLQ